MLVLITGGASELGQAIAARVIAEGHAVRLTDRAPLPTRRLRRESLTWSPAEVSQ